jgi:hypothetical protein
MRRTGQQIPGSMSTQLAGKATKRSRTRQKVFKMNCGGEAVRKTQMQWQLAVSYKRQNNNGRRTNRRRLIRSSQRAGVAGDESTRHGAAVEAAVTALPPDTRRGQERRRPRSVGAGQERAGNGGSRPKNGHTETHDRRQGLVGPHEAIRSDLWAVGVGLLDCVRGAEDTILAAFSATASVAELYQDTQCTCRICDSLCSFRPCGPFILSSYKIC